ncbi:phosphohexomutase domain-containing protein [Blattabacterium cuenoti]|uniref:phosphoglucosamine mutase n=1 Tax=Blattabacterium cuenoti TaxID=1653831 RepID=UPI00163CA809|nr:phosphoglucosamine mutase [Blattabacterium cuenoti]
MTLITTLSGIRGTLGGKINNNFTLIEIMQFIAAYATWLKTKQKNKLCIILGRDGRITSILFNQFIIILFINFGIKIIDIGLTTTPTVGFAIVNEQVDGGVILTASHNPQNWNGLKFFNSNGEFLSLKDFNKISLIVKKKYINFVPCEKWSHCVYDKNYIYKHIQSILSLPLVDKHLIRKYKFKIVVDGINSTGGIAVPMLLDELGVQVIKIHCTPNGIFQHDPEPIKKNLKHICKMVPNMHADLGISVDPDVDRAVFICENGKFFGEEYTLVSIADYVLQHTLGPVVSTLSSSQVLKDLSFMKGVPYYSTPVGEINVIQKMKKVHAVIGGEGNGGIIYPPFRYGRDALLGISLFLTYIAKLSKISLTKLKKRYPHYYMYKKKIKLYDNTNIIQLLDKIKKIYIGHNMNFKDGLKINFCSTKEWIHIRQSHTENLIRIYIESPYQKRLYYLYKQILQEIK